MPAPTLFEVATNPDADSTLPFLIRLPLAGGELVLKARDSWPRTAKVYCHRAEGWPRSRDRGAGPDPLLPTTRGRDRPRARPPTGEPLPARVHPNPRRPRRDLLAIRAHDPPSPPRDPRPTTPRRRPRAPHDHRRHPRALPLQVRPTTSRHRAARPPGRRLRHRRRRQDHRVVERKSLDDSSAA